MYGGPIPRPVKVTRTEKKKFTMYRGVQLSKFHCTMGSGFVMHWAWHWSAYSDHGIYSQSATQACVWSLEQVWLCYGTGELGYNGPLYDRLLAMTDSILGPSPMHIKYVSRIYGGSCIWRTNFPGPIESVISKFACILLLFRYVLYMYHVCK